MKIKYFLSLLVVILSGCATSEGNWKNAQETVIELASFDLNCPKEKIKLTKLNEICNGGMQCRAKSVGAEGCGKRMRYVEISLGQYAANTKPQE